MKLHPTVLAFAEEMQKELEANSHKGNWETWLDVDKQLLELQYHQAKLIMALSMENKDLIKEHLADCSNILMMIGNSHKLY